MYKYTYIYIYTHIYIYTYIHIYIYIYIYIYLSIYLSIFLSIHLSICMYTPNPPPPLTHIQGACIASAFQHDYSTLRLPASSASPSRSRTEGGAGGVSKLRTFTGLPHLLSQ